MQLLRHQEMQITKFAARFVKLFLVLALLAPALTASVSAAPGAESKAALPRTGNAKVAIAPHRAIYKMQLASVKNGGNIAGVSGRMLFEWADVCDGWAVQQHLQLHFAYSEGDESNVSSTVVSWESKDSKRYNFNVRRVSDGKVTDVYRGRATLDGDGGTVVYTAPSERTVKLAAGTVFPSAHTQMIIEKAQEGDTLFSRRVFDGSDEAGSNDISAFIHSPGAGMQAASGGDETVKSSALLDYPGWPIRMAFFKPTTETGEPDYEMNLNLLANGVARSMLMDYGDFTISGTLEEIEALPSPGC